MEIIEQLIEQKQYIPAMMKKLNGCFTYDEIIMKTDAMEEAFLRVNHARQWWHGTAYSKLNTDEERKEYRERYGLKIRTINKWCSTVKKVQKKVPILQLAQDDSLNFSHAQAVAPLIEEHSKKAKKLLKKAIKGTTNKNGEHIAIAAKVIKGEVTKFLGNKKEKPKKTLMEVMQDNADEMKKLLEKIEKVAGNIAFGLDSDPRIKTAMADRGLAERFIHTMELLAEMARRIDESKSKLQITGHKNRR